jgi:transcriptional regulator GlxA family with amidase domain
MTAPARPKVAMLLYPGLTPLDLIAPHAAFAATMETHLVWKTTDPVRSDAGVLLHPTTTFADCPADLDVLFVPGGLGQAPVAADEDVLEFLADRNRITGGGVTAGLDFALVVLAQLLGEEVAKLTQLMLEYAPAPPFDAGTPRTAGPELTAMARAGNQQLNEEMATVAEELALKGWGRAA